MGLNINIEVQNDDEFNQQLQIYLAQGYKLQSNYNGTAILKKKSYNLGVLIVLILLFLIGAIIYYLLVDDDIVTIKNTNGARSSQTYNTTADANNYVEYCEDCGHGLFKDSKFCPGCGKDLTNNGITPEAEKCPNCSAEVMDGAKFCPNCGQDLSEVEEVKKCRNCGEELMDEAKFCPNCGEDVTSKKEVTAEEPAEVIQLEAGEENKEE